METKKFLLLLSLAFSSLSPLQAEEPVDAVNKNHLLYLTRSGKIDTSIEQYKKYKELLGKHDPEILEQLALIILDQSRKSDDPEKQIIGLYGASLANVNSLLDHCESGMRSRNPMTQLVCIQMAGRIQDDDAKNLLYSAFNSPFLGIRMEAAFYLAQKKDRLAVGYIESLMHKLPPFFQCFFPEMFALIGNKEAVQILKRMIHDVNLYTRLAATLASAKFQRDDLLKDIRIAATHANPAEQEASAFALGVLQDSHSIELLEKISKSTDPQTKLAAFHALVLLGKTTYLEEIKSLAQKEDLFAISLLSLHKGSEEVLAKLIKSTNRELRFNAGISLLRLKDPRAMPVVMEILLSKRFDLGFAPSYSQGRSLLYWKVVPSASAHASAEKNDQILAIAQALREQVLMDTLELDQKHFLFVTNQLFSLEQKDLLPLAIHLLCNLQTDEVIQFLKEKAETVGSPFIRSYANLALSKLLKEPIYQTRIENWIKEQKDTEIIRFRPLANRSSSETAFSYELTPYENSALLIEALMVLVDRHEEKSIDILLEVLKNTHPSNRPVIAGLLIKTLE